MIDFGNTNFVIDPKIIVQNVGITTRTTFVYVLNVDFAKYFCFTQ